MAGELILLLAACAPEILAPQEEGNKPTTQTPDMSSPSEETPHSLSVEVVDTITLDDKLVGLVAGDYNNETGAYYLREYMGDSGLTTELGFTDSSGEMSSVVDALPSSDQRTYGRGLQMDDGRLAITYQSSDGFPVGSDGTHHGVLIVDPEANRAIADHNLYSESFGYLTRPSALVYKNDTLYVLVNNGSAGLNSDDLTSHSSVDFSDRSSALVALDNPPNQSTSFTILDLDGLQNASAMALVGHEAVIPSIDKGKAVKVDLDTLTMTREEIRIPKGIGHNGESPYDDGDVVFTGESREGASISAVDVDAGEAENLEIASLGENDLVSGAVLVDGNKNHILFNVQDRPDGDWEGDQDWTTYYVWDRDVGDVIEIAQTQALYAVPPVVSGGYMYAGAFGTNGGRHSEIKVFLGE
jgi:hypothetical protein